MAVLPGLDGERFRSGFFPEAAGLFPASFLAAEDEPGGLFPALADLGAGARAFCAAAAAACLWAMRGDRCTTATGS